MKSGPEETAELVVRHLAEIAAGRCSITLKEIHACEAEKDVSRAAMLTGLLMLHEDLQYRQSERFRVEERYRLLVQSIRDYAIYAIDPEGRIETWNPGAERLKGYAAEEAIGRNYSMFFPPEDVWAGKPVRLLEAAAKEGRVEDEGWRLRKDGTRFWASAILAAFRDESGALRGFVKVTRDMTERKHAEDELRASNAAAEALSRELESFSYSVAHDLRAPLRAVDGFSHLLLQRYAGRLDDEGKHYLERVRAGSQRMGRLIDDLLALSRVTRGELRRETVDLSGLARAVAAELRASQPGRDVELSVQEGLHAEGDPALIKVLLQNLLGNAWKYTQKRRDAVIEFGKGGRPAEKAFFVRDNGAGFEMAHSDKLFRPFSRLHTNREFEGTGIGLATAQRVVLRHGGRIWGVGEPGKGATFYFTL